MERKIKRMVQGSPTVDGAGVHLIRVLGIKTVRDFDPFLMLDSFDSTNPDDYRAGFPMHPHRGIETISYLGSGQMQHRDTLGFQDTVGSGEVQWMVAGSGIEHEERIPESGHLYGVQLWMNLPAKEKMCRPSYHAIHRGDIEEIEIAGGKGKLRLIAGEYENHRGYQSRHIPLQYYAVNLQKGAEFSFAADPERTVVLFTLQGSADVSGEELPSKTAAVLTNGDTVRLRAREDAEILVLMAKPLHESVAWGGPVVMNTKDELYTAFREMEEGTFIKDSLDTTN
jgi:redox-sensitive bicupin YhaK (pirin superfamily)